MIQRATRRTHTHTKTIYLSINDATILLYVCIYELCDRKRFHRSKMTFLDIRTLKTSNILGKTTYWAKRHMNATTLIILFCLFTCSFLFHSLLPIVSSTSNLAKWPYFITRNFISIFIFTQTFLWILYCRLCLD